MRRFHYRFSLAAGFMLCFFTSLFPFGRSGAFALSAGGAAEQSPGVCARLSHQGNSYILCRAAPKQGNIRLFLADEAGKPLNYFRNIRSFLARRGEKPLFLMNAGMYHKDFSPVGLYISESKTLYPANRRSGAGNFFMKPNGIFYLSADKTGSKAGVMETEAFLRAKIKPQLATQSGPLLVLSNQIHPRFIKDSEFKEYRNGVGVNRRGEALFVISEGKVNFYDFAHFFRDYLRCPNALFLDGSISSLYAPELGRADWFFAMGPIIGAVAADYAQP